LVYKTWHSSPIIKFRNDNINKNEKTILIILLSILFTLLVYIWYSTQPDIKFENRIIYPLSGNEQNGSSSQRYSFENFKYGQIDRFGSDNIPKPYYPNCEKELVNKYSTNKEGLVCINTYFEKLSNSNIVRDIYNARNELLSCLVDKDPNLYQAISVNFRGIDIILMDSITYPVQCAENKEILNKALYFFSIILIFGFLYIVSNFKGIFLVIGSFVMLIYMVIMPFL